MLTITNLSKHYGTSTALSHINLHVDKGIILGLLGPNGAGKTTLVSILNGLTTFDRGEVEVLGMALGKNIREIRSRSAFIPQSLAFYDKLTVLENLRFFAGIQNIPISRRKQVIDRAIAVNHLEAMCEQRAGTLSGGEKRRINIAIGLLNDPDILYFDEPTTGIDPALRNALLQTIHSFKDEGKTIIYTSHYMEEIEKICDEAAIINQGKIICHEKISTLLHKGNRETNSLEEIFLGLTQGDSSNV